MAGRKVAFAQLQGNYQQPGVKGLSTLGKTLSSALQRGIKMVYTDTDLEVTLDGISFAIPKPNVVGVTFEKVDLEKSSESKGS